MQFAERHHRQFPHLPSPASVLPQHAFYPPPPNQGAYLHPSAMNSILGVGAEATYPLAPLHPHPRPFFDMGHSNDVISTPPSAGIHPSFMQQAAAYIQAHGYQAAAPSLSPVSSSHLSPHPALLHATHLPVNTIDTGKSVTRVNNMADQQQLNTDCDSKGPSRNSNNNNNNKCKSDSPNDVTETKRPTKFSAFSIDNLIGNVSNVTSSAPSASHVTSVNSRPEVTSSMYYRELEHWLLKNASSATNDVTKVFPGSFEPYARQNDVIQATINQRHLLSTCWR